MVAAAAVATGPRYAPHDPTLPEPWRALVDGSTGYLYYWNPESNVTQYEKPVPPPPPLPAGPPPAISAPKLAPIPTGASVQGQQAGGSGGSVATEDNRGGRMGNELHSDANKNGVIMQGQPKLVAIPVIRNQQGMGVMNSSHIPARHANGSGVSQPVPSVVPNMYQHAASGHNYSNPNLNMSHRMHGSSDIPSSAMHRSSDLPSSAAVEAYRQQHEVTASGENVPPPFMTFDAAGFPPELLRELQNAGFTSPTPIQAQSWPVALQNRDIVAIAKTGSGKTLGYLLPAFLHLRRCRNNSQMGPTVLVLSPTRELATQIQDEAIKFGRSSRISCTCLYGGAPKGPQLKDLERGADVVVATPGRLNDILEMKKVSLRQVSFLVLDEADRMLDMGFEPQIRKIVNEIPPRRQTLMYTATWPKEVRKIAGDLLVNPVQVNIGDVDELSANKSITQYVEVVPPMEKQRRVEHILRSQEPGSKIIIFCSTKRMCDQLARSLGRQFGAAPIHGDKSQGERDWVLSQFRTGKSPVLVATDVAARGLDIKDIRVVINFDFPTGVEDYVHRIGRTGRAGATGLAYTFFSDQDAKYAPELIKVLEGANQRVPQELRDMAVRAGNFMKGRGGRWDYGGRGGRDGGRAFGGGRGEAFGARGGWGTSGGRSDRQERSYVGFGGRGRYERDGRERYDGGRDSFDTDGRDRHEKDRYDRYLGDRDRGRDGYKKADERDRGRSYSRSYSRSPSRSRARNYSRSRSRSRSHDRYADRFNSYRGRSPAKLVGKSPLGDGSSPRRSRSPVRSFSPRRGRSPVRSFSPRRGRSPCTTNRNVSPTGSRSPYYGVPCMSQASYRNAGDSSPPSAKKIENP